MRKILLPILIVITGVCIIYPIFAQQKSAIGVRVMANNEHLPIAIWYEAQNFLKQGSPSYTQVDGYDAMRDGRTVYVNAINVICPQVQDSSFCLKSQPSGTDKCAYAIDCADASDKTEYPNFYTNVYVISVSDEDADAQDMFSQILNNWRFNININVNNMCAYASDISACKTAIGGEKGVAELQTKLRRDGRRISDVVFMQAVLENYKNAQGHYPTLKSGTYLESQTISKWPSWNETLGQELGTAVPLDPVNSFGVCGADNPDCYCEGYDANTCWDNKSRLFNGTRDVKSGMPESAFVYYYKSSSNGASYEFNGSRWETSYIGGESVVKMQAAHSASNTKPVISGISAVKMSPNETKIVEAQAYDYNQFTEKISWADLMLAGTTKDADKLCSALASDEQCCIAAAVLEPNAKQADKFDGSKFISYKNLKITAGANICKGKINLQVFDDGIKNVDNSALESDVSVVEADVRNQLPAFPSGISTYSAETVVGYPWEYSVQALDAEDKTLTYKILGGPNWLSFEGGGAEKISSSGVKILGAPNATGNYNFSIEAKDSKGGIAALAIALTVTNKNPAIASFPADEEKHINENFSYQIKASDEDGHKLIYSMTCEPEINCGSILNIDSETGKIASPDNFTTADYGEYNFKVKAVDDYGGEAIKEFNLKITPWCGNGVVENWSASGASAWMEQCESAGKGTSVNDQYDCVSCKWAGGYCGDGTVQNGAAGAADYKEQCEAGGAGTSASDQYSCASCRWAGGYCGDGTVQNGAAGTVDYKEQCESAGNGTGKNDQYSCASCQWAGGWCGDGTLNGTEFCDKTEPEQACTGMFSEGLPSYCQGIPLTGTQSCNDSCTGWNTCVALPPTETKGTSSACASTNEPMTNYACCELVSCVNDGCGCCGRNQGNSEWLSLEREGYSVTQTMSPCEGDSCKCWGGNNFCECGTEGCNNAPSCNTNNASNGSCKLNRSNADARNWYIETNHTTTEYRCWR